MKINIGHSADALIEHCTFRLPLKTLFVCAGQDGRFYVVINSFQVWLITF